MKANPEKCRLLSSNTTSIVTKIKDNEIMNNESEKLLGAIEDKLNFNSHLQKNT